MDIIFVNYHHFIDSSGIHIFFLANELERLGIKCTVCVPKCRDSVTSFGVPLFKTISYASARLEALLFSLKGQKEKTIVHAWTPRENVRRMSLFLSKLYSIPYCVHLEDNEEAILASHLGMPYAMASRLPFYKFLRLPLPIIRPKPYRTFLAGASGVTCIMDDLRNFVPPGIPILTFWPSCEKDFFEIPPKPDLEVKRSLGISLDESVVTYTGNVHQTNVEEVANLYIAVGLLNKQGIKVRLIRTGSDHVSMRNEALEASKKHILQLGSCPPSELINYIAVADLLVQPGRSGVFNDYRFPSKLPMYLASGRPVILPPTNIGAHMTDCVECLHLNDGSPEDIALKMNLLLKDNELAKVIGRNGREFARNNFSWTKTAQGIKEFYEHILANNIIG